MKKIAVERLKFIGLMWIGISVLMLYSLPHHHHGEQPFLAHLCTSDCEHTTDHPEKGVPPFAGDYVCQGHCAAKIEAFVQSDRWYLEEIPSFHTCHFAGPKAICFFCYHSFEQILYVAQSVRLYQQDQFLAQHLRAPPITFFETV